MNNITEKSEVSTSKNNLIMGVIPVDEWLLVLEFRTVLGYLAVLLGIFGNTLTLLCFVVNKKLRTPAHAFIANIEALDLVYCLTGLLIYTTETAFKRRVLISSEFMCRFQMFFSFTWIQASPLALSAITLNRLIAVRWPTKYDSYFSKRNTAMLIALVWIIPYILNFLTALDILGSTLYAEVVLACYVGDAKPGDKEYLFVQNLLMTCTTTIFIIVSYALIYCRIRSTSSAVSGSLGVENRQARRRARQDRKLAVTASVICGFYILTVAPYFALSVLPLSRPLFVSRGLMAVIFSQNVYVNFILYAITNPRIRAAYKQILTCNHRVSISIQMNAVRPRQGNESTTGEGNTTSAAAAALTASTKMKSQAVRTENNAWASSKGLVNQGSTNQEDP